MKFSAALVTALVPSVYGHYFWNKLIVNGTETGDMEFVRRTTRAIAYNPIKWKNPLDNSTPDLDDIRCNQGSFSSAGSTGVKEVAAGSNVGFKLGVGATARHPGPAMAYISKAPGSVKEYRGDGPWIKIWETGVCNTAADITTNAWCTWDKDTLTFDLPKDLLNGEYLLRIEHIGLHGAHDGQAEFYPACAQIKVTGGSETGDLGPGILLPGGYKRTDPSFNFSIWNGYKPYPFPGGPMYKGIQGGSGNDTSAAPAPAPTSTSAAGAGGVTSVPTPTTLQTATTSASMSPSTTASVQPGNGGLPTALPSAPASDGSVSPSSSSSGAPLPAPTTAPGPPPAPGCPGAPRRHRRGKHPRVHKKAKKAVIEVQY